VRNRCQPTPDAARVRALAAYRDFLALWKDADPDIPILKEAKAECEAAMSGDVRGKRLWAPYLAFLRIAATAINRPA
jgi:hypothetical protein